MMLFSACSKSWKGATFKDYNFSALGLPPSGGSLHPLLKVGRILLSLVSLQFSCRFGRSLLSEPQLSRRAMFISEGISQGFLLLPPSTLLIQMTRCV
jgi:hypothetical protein